MRLRANQELVAAYPGTHPRAQKHTADEAPAAAIIPQGPQS